MKHTHAITDLEALSSYLARKVNALFEQQAGCRLDAQEIADTIYQAAYHDITLTRIAVVEENDPEPPAGQVVDMASPAFSAALCDRKEAS